MWKLKEPNTWQHDVMTRSNAFVEGRTITALILSNKHIHFVEGWTITALILSQQTHSLCGRTDLHSSHSVTTNTFTLWKDGPSQLSFCHNKHIHFVEGWTITALILSQQTHSLCGRTDLHSSHSVTTNTFTLWKDGPSQLSFYHNKHIHFMEGRTFTALILSQQTHSLCGRTDHHSSHSITTNTFTLWKNRPSQLSFCHNKHIHFVEGRTITALILSQQTHSLCGRTDHHSSHAVTTNTFPVPSS